MKYSASIDVIKKYIIQLVYAQRLANNISLFLILAIAEVYKNQGNEDYRKRDFINAIHFYTEGIKVKCKDDNLIAQLYSNRAIANFKLGKNWIVCYLWDFLLWPDIRVF